MLQRDSFLHRLINWDQKSFMSDYTGFAVAGYGYKAETSAENLSFLKRVAG